MNALKTECYNTAVKIVGLHLLEMRAEIRGADEAELVRLVAEWLERFPEKFIRGSLKSPVALIEKKKRREAQDEALDLWSYLG